MKQWENLTVLILSNNSLSTLHFNTFQNLTKLQALELQHNKLQSLPEVIFHNLLEVQYLNLSFNNLNRVPTKLFLQCTRLETLDLQGNELWWIEQDALNSIDNNVTVAVSDFANVLLYLSQMHFSTTPIALPDLQTFVTV